MTERLYAQAGEPGSAALPAAAALQCTLLPSDVPGSAPSWHVRRAELVCAALFSVLTESQQERALQALGWQLVPQERDGTEPTAAIHDPEPSVLPGMPHAGPSYGPFLTPTARKP